MYEIKKVKIGELKPYGKNARTHSAEQIAQIMQSIKEFGFTNPLLVDSDYNIIAGHGRFEAIKSLNKVDFAKNPILELPCVICEGLSEVQIKALIIADNKIALNAGWDLDLLASELRELDNIGFDLDLTGFSKSEIGELFSDFEIKGEDEDKPEPKFKNIQYQPTLEKQPALSELLDLTQYNKKIKEIETLQISQEFKDFLKYRATAFIEFKFDIIAEYYAHANEYEQKILEDFICVIIDIDDAIEKGILELKDLVNRGHYV